MKAAEKKVFKKILSNGLTVLVSPSHQIPKVSTQIWYGVGSKDEKTEEKGLAHLLEHMMFKGTEKMSESDINVITSTLSGSANAFTSYDYTGYLFEMPRQHWKQALSMFADCMSGCTFKEDLLNSELKAVIQELKMYKDNYQNALIEEMASAIFTDHPYHSPIIGYKQDLLKINRKHLLDFYKSHYVPNNATLVVVGDVQPEEVFEIADKEFGHINPCYDFVRQSFVAQETMSAKSITLYRDVQQGFAIACFIIPGAREKKDYALDIMTSLVASGRGSRLYKKLVDELDLVTEIDAMVYDLFDYGCFLIEFQPKNIQDVPQIMSVIRGEISSLVQNGFSDQEFARASKRAQMQYISGLESNEKVAYALGKEYMATGDEQYIFNYVIRDQDELRKQLSEVFSYLDVFEMHTGIILPMTDEQKKKWLVIQEKSDAFDTQFLSEKVRESAVEPPVLAQTIQPLAPVEFSYPKYQEIVLSNGLEVLFYKTNRAPKIEMILDLKAKYFYDPDQQQGIGNFVSEMLLKGTQKYPGQSLVDEIESRGMNVVTTPGVVSMSMLSSDLVAGVDILASIVSQASFEDRAIEQIRAKILVDLKNYWDTPTSFIGHLVGQQIYKNHPYSKNVFGDASVIKSLCKKDLIDYYQKVMTPQKARLVVVGDFDESILKNSLEKNLGSWRGDAALEISFPQLTPIRYHEVNHYINRDQVVLAFAGLSVPRTDKDFDKLLLFEQIFSGGVLGSMSSRLFAVREQTGLFYTIGGSLLARSDEQPGSVFVRTIVSLDRLAEAEKAISNVINTSAADVSQDEYQQARNALVNSLVDNFETNRQMAVTFLFLKRYGLSKDYFDHRAQQLMSVTKEDMQEAAQKILNTNKMVLVRAGRV
jgi:zinc protease